MSKNSNNKKPASNVKKGAAKATAAKSPAKDKISLNDVKEATNASRNVINFPTEAPQEAFPADDAQANVDTPNVDTPTDKNPIPPDAPGTPESVSANASEASGESAPAESVSPSEGNTEDAEEIKHEVEVAVEHAVEESIEEVTEKVVEALEAAVEPVEEKKPSIQEQMLEKWLNGRNNVNHFELANSGVVDLNHFAMFEGVIGKFKFKRSHPGDNWQITVE